MNKEGFQNKSSRFVRREGFRREVEMARKSSGGWPGASREDGKVRDPRCCEEDRRSEE
jgi:hypothetical protein